MAIRFELDARNLRAVRFATSPLVEAGLGLNALLFPGWRAVQHPWIRSMRELSPALRRELRAFGFALDFGLPDLVLPDPGRATETRWVDALGAIAALPAEVAAYEIARPAFGYLLDLPRDPAVLSRREVREQLDARARPHGRASLTLVRMLARNPASVRERFLALLQGFWDEAFSATWERLGPALARAARRDARLAAAGGVYAVLEGEFAGTVVNRRAGWFERESPHAHVVRPTRANPVAFVPSVLAWPHLRVACDPPWPLTVIYPHRDVRAIANTPPPDDDVGDALAALAHPLRLRVLRSLAERPRTTQEVAQLCRLTPPGASHHLTKLAASGFATSERDGHYVLYRAVPERLGEVHAALAGYLAPPPRRRGALHERGSRHTDTG